ncbi:MAG: inorganic phosphate transporter [Clostridia bacterium]|nr:inorganic phosphate transporter [Clostridia bacterium]
MTDFFNMHFLVSAALILSAVFVNGWTDAPNAVATCVASGAMTLRRAANMAAVCNFFGLLLTSAFGNRVAKRVAETVPSGNGAEVAVYAALLSVVVFAVVAWSFGIPTSESHALLAALSGAAVAKEGKNGLNSGLWWSVILGIILTSLLGFLLGYVLKRLLNVSRLREKRRLLTALEIISAALLSLIHGAQDGQKFTIVAMSVFSFSGLEITYGAATLLCAVVLALGTAVGGARIIKKVGSGITAVDEGGGVCCDTAAFISIFVCTLFGMPVSTTHTKTSAVLGLGVANRNVNTKTYYEIFSLWLLTFPVCFILGWGITRLCL